MCRMRLFRRDAPPEGPDVATAAFWQWWDAQGREAVTLALSERDPERVAPQLSDRVAAIHPGLAWELAAGSIAEHVLVVSPEGNPELRALAHRWLAAAPAMDPTWEYAAARQPAADPEGIVLRVGDEELALRDVRVGAHREGSHLDVTVHHPAFARLDEQARSQVAFLALDASLGEDHVEAWVGSITAATEPPLETFGLAGLRPVLRDLREDHTRPDGSPHWVTLEGEGDQGPVLAMAQVPLSPVTAPTFDTHVAVLVPYTDTTEHGYPGPAALEALGRLEADLAERIGSSGRVVAHQSHRGTRVLHVYVDSTTSAVERMRSVVEAWPQGRIRVQVTPDPAWLGVAHLRG